MAIGAWSYDHAELETRRASCEQLDIKVVGMVHMANDVTPELARYTVQSITVYGTLHASHEVNEALAGWFQ